MKGFRIGDDTYGSYDVVRRPLISSSSNNYIIPENNDLGLPTLQDNGVYGMNSFHYTNQGNSEPLIDDMTSNINNGRVKDVLESTKVDLPNVDNVMVHDNQETAVKGLLEETELSNIFFSNQNIDALQMSIRYGVNQRSGQVISTQSENELYIVMRSIMLQYANFKSGN